MIEVLKQFWNKYITGAATTSSTDSADMDAFLAQQECLVINFNTYKSNPSQLILGQSNPYDFKDFILKYKQGYKPVYVFRRSVGNDRFEYSTFNNYVGVQTTC